MTDKGDCTGVLVSFLKDSEKIKATKDIYDRGNNKIVYKKGEVITYFEIGRLLHEAGKHYGESIIKKYSAQLKKVLKRGKK